MKTRNLTVFRSMAAVGLLATTLPANAAFEIRKSQAVPAQGQEAIFDVSEYSVWVDNTYEAVVHYGRKPMVTPAATYGDKMPLSDALKILSPDGWKTMRAKDLDLEGKLVVSWDLESATWMDVLKNLGERHGLQFHVDHNRKELFVKNGKRLVFDRPERIGLEERYPAASDKKSFDRVARVADKSVKVPAPQLKAAAPTAVSLNADELNNSAFTINAGDDGEAVLEDLALIFGYERLIWMVPDQKVQKTQTFTGDATQIMAQVVSQFKGRVCLYDVDMTAAVIPTSMECPK